MAQILIGRPPREYTKFILVYLDKINLLKDWHNGVALAGPRLECFGESINNEENVIAI